MKMSLLSEFAWAAAIGIAALVTASVGAELYDRIKKRSDFDSRMRKLARGVAKRGRSEYQFDFDFSPTSIEKVEAVLDQLHRMHLVKPLNDDELAVLSLRWGAYVGEALKRVRPGRWQRDSKIGPGTLPLVYKAGYTAFPRSWVYKRIVDGEGDNIVSKFYVASHLDELKNAPPTEPLSKTG
jgi:hypothetical protein